MGLLDVFTWVLSPPLRALSEVLAKEIDETVNPPEGRTTTTPEQAAQARVHLALAAAGVGAVVAAPALYIAYKGRKRGKKRKMSEKDIMYGRSLENASLQATALLSAAVATPAIGTAAAYILVQKLEDGKLISKGLGDAAQALMTVAAAGPAVGGILGGLTSAFTKAK